MSGHLDRATQGTITVAQGQRHELALGIRNREKGSSRAGLSCRGAEGTQGKDMERGNHPCTQLHLGRELRAM